MLAAPEDPPQPKPATRLSRRLPRHSPFFVVNGAFTSLLVAAIVFGIKGLTVWIHHTTAATRHVQTADVASMWAVMVTTAAFFVVTVVLVTADVSVGWHVDNLNAYLFAVTALFLHACTLFAACAGADRTSCAYMYPASRFPLVEAAVHCALLALVWLTSFAFNLSMRWCRPYIFSQWAFGGALCMGLIVPALVAAHRTAASAACGHLDSVIKQGWSEHDALPLAVAAAASPALIVLAVALENVVIWQSSSSDDETTENSDSVAALNSVHNVDAETYQSKVDPPAWVRRALHLAVHLAAVFLLVGLHERDFLPAYVTWVAVTSVGLGGLCTMLLWVYHPARNALGFLQIPRLRMRRRATPPHTGQDAASTPAKLQPPLPLQGPAPVPVATSSSKSPFSFHTQPPRGGGLYYMALPKTGNLRFSSAEEKRRD